MRKTTHSFVAVLATALCGSATADNNVSIYGVADINFTHGSAGGLSVNAIDSGGISGSRLGFRGKEGLGSGINAVFELEYGLKIDQDTGISSARQQFVGLEGGFGSVLAGFIYSPADDFNAGYDGLSNSGLLSARSNMLNDGGFTTKTEDTFKNAIAYISPNFGGLTMRGVVGFGEQTTGTVERKYALSGEYVAGPFKTMGVYHKISNYTADPAKDIKELALGVSYDFGFAKLMGTHVGKKVGSGAQDKSWSLGAHVPAGEAGSIRLSYAVLDMANDNGNKDAKGWTLAYFHSLSKRTTLYTGYHALDNGDNASYGHEQLKPLTTGNNARLYAVGMRHKF
jgi:predicted porin